MPLLIFILTISKWTVACYFAADNNIGPFAIQDIEELKTIGSTQAVNIVAQIDYWSTNSPSTCHRYFIAKDSIIFIEDIGEVNTGDPKTLAEFGKWAFLNYPASHYLLIIWDHGTGWLKSKYKGVGWDETSGDWLSVAEGELASALSEITTTIKRPIDILAFDACVMGGAEVMAEATPYAIFFVGSEDVIPLNGFPYDSIMSFLTSCPYANPQIVADSIVSAYSRSYVGTQDTVSLARIDLSYIPVLESRTKEFAQSLKLDPSNPVIRTARERLRDFGNLASVDIGEFAQFIADNLSGQIGENAIKVKETISFCSFCKFLGPKVNGISLWFPIDYHTFLLMVYDYINLNFSKHTEWEKFIYKFYGVPDTLPPLSCKISDVYTLPNNSFKINWTPSYDLSAIKNYELQELNGVTTLLEDGAEAGSSNWKLNGFTISSSNPHTGMHSFFSGGGSMELSQPIKFEQGAIMDFFYFQKGGRLNCKWSVDTLNWITLTSIRDREPAWRWNTVDLPGAGYIKFEFLVGSGVFIDDIRVRKFASNSIVYQGAESSFTVKRKPKSTYWYRVRAIDEYGNKSQWSELYPVSVKDRLIPYGYPSPFTNGTKIIYDIPETATGEIYIYTISGKLIKKLQIDGFKASGADHQEVFWDGKNSLNEEIASGIYICLLKTPEYTATFKLAKVK